MYPNRTRKTGKDPLFTTVDVGGGRVDTLPPGVKGLRDGGLVFVDYRRSRHTQTQTPMQMVHEGALQESNQPLAAFFITMDHVLTLVRGVEEMGKASVQIAPMSMIRDPFGAQTEASTAPGYQHMILSVSRIAPKQQNVEEGKSINISLEIIPSEVSPSHAELEDGEIEQPSGAALPYVCRNFSSVLRMYASHVTETHKDSDSMYVHGMRKIAGYIGWCMCECPQPQTISVPSVPPWLTVEECCEVIRRMDLEVFERTDNPFGSGAVGVDTEMEEDGGNHSGNLHHRERKPDAPVVNRHHPSEWDTDHRRYVPMYVVLQEAMKESAIIQSLNIAVKVRDTEKVSVLPSLDDNAMDDHQEPRNKKNVLEIVQRSRDNPDREKTSVYPMGMLSSR